MTKLEEIIKQYAEHINRTPEEFLEAVAKVGMVYDDSGKLCNLVDGKLIPAESQERSLSMVYNYLKQEALKVSSSVTSTVVSGTADVLPSDDGKTQAIKKVILPTLIEILARELHCSPEIAQEAITKNGILYDSKEDRFYDPQVSADAPVEFEEVVKCGRDYLASLVAPAETLPKAEAAVLPDAEVRVAVPIQLSKEDYFKQLIQELQKEQTELEEVLGRNGYHIQEGKGFYHFSSDPAKLDETIRSREVSESEVRDFLLEYYTNPQSEAAASVASEQATPTDLETAVDEEIVNIDDVVAEDPLDVQLTLEEKEKYIGPLALAHGKSFERIEAFMVEKGIYLDKDGNFHRHLPERDGHLKGEEIPITDFNNMLGDYFDAERLPIITEPTVAPDSSRDTIPETKAVLPPIKESTNQSKVEDKFYQNGDAPHTSDKGFEKAIAEAATSAKPEDIAKRPLWTYIAGGIGAIAVLGLTHLIVYDSGRTVGEAGKTVIQDKVGAALVDDLNTQISDLGIELNAVSADNENYTSDKEIMTLNYDFCEKKWGETKKGLEQKSVAYANLEQQLAAAPDAQEFVALKDRNAKLETEKEQFRIKVQETEQKYGECAAAKTTCESAAPTIEYVDRIVEREVPVEKIVEKEVVKYVNRECPDVICPEGDTELPAKYDDCMKEKETAVQTIEDGDTSCAICEANREAVQFVYDGCMGELYNTSRTTTSDSRYVAIKEIIDSNKNDSNKSKELELAVDSYLLRVGTIETIGSTCAEGLGSLYNVFVSVDDDKTKSEFVRLLDASRPCGEIPTGTNYIKFNVVNE